MADAVPNPLDHINYHLRANDFDANTILAATVDNTPAAVTVPEQTLVGRVTGGNVGALTPAQATDLLATNGPIHTDLRVGEANMSRAFISSGVGPSSSGQLVLVAFTARKSEPVAAVRISTHTTAAGATPSLCKIGFFRVEGSGAMTDDLTLLAVTANDTSLFASATTAYTKSFTAPASKVAGVRYAVGVLVVSAAPLPNFGGFTLANSLESSVAPWTCATLAGQSDIAGDITATLVASNKQLFAAVLP